MTQKYTNWKIHWKSEENVKTERVRVRVIRDWLKGACLVGSDDHVPEKVKDHELMLTRA